MKKEKTKTVKVNGCSFRFNSETPGSVIVLACETCPFGLEYTKRRTICDLLKNPIPRAEDKGNTFNDFCLVNGDITKDALRDDLECLIPNPDDVLDFIKQTETEEVYKLFKSIKDSYKEEQKGKPTAAQKKLIKKIKSAKLAEYLDNLSSLLQGEKVFDIKI